jgi:hypothetical protein
MPVFSPPGFIQQRVTTILGAQLETLSTTPVVVLPPAGGNLVNVPISVFGLYYPDTDLYGTLSGAMRVRIAGNNNEVFFTTNNFPLSNAWPGILSFVPGANGGWGLDGVDPTTYTYQLSAANPPEDPGLGRLDFVVLYYQILYTGG